MYRWGRGGWLRAEGLFLEPWEVLEQLNVRASGKGQRVGLGPEGSPGGGGETLEVLA